MRYGEEDSGGCVLGDFSTERNIMVFISIRAILPPTISRLLLQFSEDTMKSDRAPSGGDHRPKLTALTRLAASSEEIMFLSSSTRTHSFKANPLDLVL